MPAQTPEVVIHGGVHKTATSHIQSILQRNAGKLRKSGVHYVHHRDTRKEYTVPIQLNQYRKPRVTDSELVQKSRDFFGKIGAGPGERIVLSDENMPGHCGHCVRDGGLYLRSDVLLPLFAKHIPYPVTELHLAVRDYADFFASAFIEFLRSATGDNLITEATMKRAVLSNLPNWAGFIDFALACFPDAQLVIWRHEDFGALSDTVIGNLCGPGIDVASLAAPQRKRGRPSASHRAVQELLIEIERNGGDAALARRVEIQDAYPRGPDYPGYDPWSADERAHLARLYDKDTAEIALRERVTLLRP
ncbi:hypothetical protein DC366_06360 [Pelagivirga sediminicola]|uniref:Sulfotransferase domain-containing protein n=1 Tax=Pelagivirga sediminicola TaxID=2170575 RepID=A0A2T7G7Y8_9RHOB|nr:hypothetical protein [Pelagivirga sediminicola]PVA10529.1 hypothetical protein DC366_06360 [Pelagivirga sediminicola]